VLHRWRGRRLVVANTGIVQHARVVRCHLRFVFDCCFPVAGPRPVGSTAPSDTRAQNRSRGKWINSAREVRRKRPSNWFDERNNCRRDYERPQRNAALPAATASSDIQDLWSRNLRRMILLTVNRKLT
jgi:hypothetical protein